MAGESNENINSQEDKANLKQLQKLFVEKSDIALELEKTREMLKLQYKLNEEIIKEKNVALTNEKSSENEQKVALEECKHLLAIRADRIQKLEKQLKDVALGDAIDSRLILSSIDRPRGWKSQDGVNELHIKIIGCRNLVFPKNKDIPPVFILYRLLGLPEQETSVMPPAISPEFDDHRSFLLKTDSALHQCLISQCLHLFVVANNKKIMYLSETKIPLSNLSSNLTIARSFKLKNSEGKKAGLIDVLIFWQFPYSPPFVHEEKPQELFENLNQKEAQKNNPSSFGTCIEEDLKLSNSDTLTSVSSIELSENESESYNSEIVHTKTSKADIGRFALS